ncbi:MAG TPA: hypothetical protein VGS41_07755 [Chthonomonadales bacterium]|nr:hypothetical protein [Chthonomonadales bacterium]
MRTTTTKEPRAPASEVPAPDKTEHNGRHEPERNGNRLKRTPAAPKPPPPSMPVPRTWKP